METGLNMRDDDHYHAILALHRHCLRQYTLVMHVIEWEFVHAPNHSLLAPSIYPVKQGPK
jgi:hypothetical protein